MSQENIEEINTLIIGGGLSGIYAAALLINQKESSVMVLEARDRIGGRILCKDYGEFVADLGPSWFWPMINPRVNALVHHLDLKTYPQFEKGFARFQAKNGQAQTCEGNPMYPAGYRIKGGMISLVNGLCQTVPKGVVRLNHPVCEIEQKANGILVTVGRHDQAPQCRILARKVILALPPRLAARSILFTPDLSYQLTQAMLKASTWMAGQAKFFSLYDRADWRDSGLSGQGFALSGPLGEIHDGSAEHQSPCGLTGFLRIPALRRKETAVMTRAILDQLPGLYGKNAGAPLSIFYQDWAKEEFTATHYDLRSAHNHPEFHPPGQKMSIWNDTLFFAGSETADEMGGYLEGALTSAERVVLKMG